MYYLYVKKHNVTKLKYLGQTKNTNPRTYKGSGKYWRRHIKKHGYDVTTTVLLETEDIDELCRVSNFFSDFFDVVNSKKWANLIPETGVTINGVNETGKNLYGYNGRTPNVPDNFKRGRKTQQWLRENDQEWVESWKNKISQSLKGLMVGENNPFYGKSHTEETIKKISRNNSISQAGAKNSQYGTMWITDGTQDKKINKKDKIPNGWIHGRAISVKNEIIKKQKHKEKQDRKIKDREKKIKYLRDLYKIYVTGGFKSVQDAGYAYTQVNLINQFKKYLTEFESKHGKRRRL